MFPICQNTKVCRIYFNGVKLLLFKYSISLAFMLKGAIIFSCCLRSFTEDSIVFVFKPTWLWLLENVNLVFKFTFGFLHNVCMGLRRKIWVFKWLLWVFSAHSVEVLLWENFFLISVGGHWLLWHNDTLSLNKTSVSAYYIVVDVIRMLTCKVRTVHWFVYLLRFYSITGIFLLVDCNFLIWIGVSWYNILDPEKLIFFSWFWFMLILLYFFTYLLRNPDVLSLRIKLFSKIC